MIAPLPSWVRVVREPGIYPPGLLAQIKKPSDVVRCIAGALIGCGETEAFIAVPLDSQSRPLGVVKVSDGGRAACIVDVPLVFRLAVALGACGLVVAHNHPSGDTTPSPEDVKITAKLRAAGDLLDIPLYDHLIVTTDPERFLSFVNSGMWEM